MNHDTFKIVGENNVIYTDPYEIEEQVEKADFVTVSHSHLDHLSIDDIKKVIKGNTIILASKNCQDKLKELKADIKYLISREKVEFGQISFFAVPAYNINKFRALGQPFHPRQQNGVGLIISIGKYKIYHAGDTDNIPEASNFGQVNIALLPVSGTYVMTADEAVEMVKVLKPKVAIPMHYGSIIGTQEDAKRFKDKASKYCEVVILKN